MCDVTAIVTKDKQERRLETSMGAEMGTCDIVPGSAGVAYDVAHYVHERGLV